jgi:hypothetical protein
VVYIISKANLRRSTPDCQEHGMRTSVAGKSTEPAKEGVSTVRASKFHLSYVWGKGLDGYVVDISSNIEKSL